MFHTWSYRRLISTSFTYLVKNSKIFYSTRRSMSQKFCADICLAKTRIVCQACAEYGFELQDQTDDNCHFIWKAILHNDELAELKPHQKINKLPNAQIVTHKQKLANTLKRVQRLTKDNFEFIPKSWDIPDELPALLRSHGTKQDKFYILKPSVGSCASGIRLLNSFDNLEKEEQCILQNYIDEPALIEGRKFDLRLYVLVSSIKPLKIFLHGQGMVRLATQTYKPPTNENKDDFFIHLTNTTLNKKNKTENSGLTRKLDWYKGHLKEQGHNFEAVLEQVKDVLVKTMLAGHPYMNYSYEKHRPKSESVNGSHCFHLFGVDVILDQQFKPWLIELNGNPSLFGQLPDMKMQIFKDVLNVLNLREVLIKFIPALKKMNITKNLINIVWMPVKIICKKKTTT
eukprot:TCONS_00027705-protein